MAEPDHVSSAVLAGRPATRQVAVTSGFAPALALRALPIVALLLLPLAITLPIARTPFGVDDWAYATVASELSQGAVLYRDVFDHKPPVIHLWHLALLTGGLDTPAALRISVAASLGATSVLLMLVAREFLSKKVALVVAALFAMTSSGLVLILYDASIEQLMLLPMTASLLMFLRGRERGALGYLVAAGALGALAIWTKPVAVTNLVAILGFAWWAPGELRRHPLPSRLGAPAGGAALVSLAFVVALAGLGAGPSAFDALVTFNIQYGQNVDLATRLQFLRSSASILPVLLGPVLPLALLGLLAASRWRPSAYVIPVAWLMASTAGVMLTGYLFPHYFVQLLPALCLCSGWIFTYLDPRRSRGRALLAAVVLVPATLLTLPAGLAYSLTVARQAGASPVSAEAIGSLREVASDRTTLYVNGPWTRLYIESGLRPAHRLFYPWVFDSRPDGFTVLVRDLDGNPADVIVDDRRPPPNWRISGRHESTEWFALLEQRYVLMEEPEPGFLIFVRRDDVPGPP